MNARRDNGDEGPRLTVRGRVAGPDEAPVAGVGVRAFHKALRREIVLGETRSDEDGTYRIRYAPRLYGVAEATVNLFVRAVDARGRALAESDVVFGAKDDAAIDLRLEGRQQPIDPPSTAFERAIAAIAAVAGGLAPSALRDDDIAVVAQAARLDAREVRSIARAARLSVETGLPAELFVAIAAGDPEPLDLRAALARGENAIREAIRVAIEAKAVPAALERDADRLVAALDRLKRDERFTIAGRVVSDDGPLAGHTVRVFALEDDVARALGDDVTSAGGHFAVRVPFAHPPRLRFRVVRPDGMAVADIDQEIDRLDRPVEIKVPADSLRHTTTTGDLIDTLGFRVSERLDRALGDRDQPLAWLRDPHGERVKRLAADLDDVGRRGLRHLLAHARLSVISPDAGVREQLIARDFRNLGVFAHTSRRQFVSAMRDHVGEAEATRLYAAGRAMGAYAANVTTGILADAKVPNKGLDGTLAPEPPAHCHCEDCEAAVSPAAYLADLIQYTQTHLYNNNQRVIPDVNPTYLRDTFHQDFLRLAASCEAVNERVRLARIAVEVLRRYLEDHPPTAAQQQALTARQHEYLLAAYSGLVQRLGTSYAELRLATSGTPDAREALASRLGLSSASLDHMFIPEPALTEELLGEVFGLAATMRNDGSLPDPLAAAPEPQLLAAKKQHLRTLWREIDWPADPYGDRVLFATAADAAVTAALNGGNIPGGLRDAFAAADVELDAGAVVVQAAAPLNGALWFLDDAARTYLVRQTAAALVVQAERARPLVDPDLIGPDDFRSPVPGQAVFDLWTKRREWVDARWQALRGANAAAQIAAMSQPVQYAVDAAAVAVTAWAAAPQRADLDALQDRLARGEDIEAAQQTIGADLNLTVESFTRLMELWSKARRHDQNIAIDAVTDVEWDEVASILAAALKLAARRLWIREERRLQIELGAARFWISVREPLDGAWPPPHRPPLVDPEVSGLEDRPDPFFGRPAIDLWHARRVWLDDEDRRLRQVYRDALAANPAADGFAAILRDAFGDPLPADFDALYAVLNQGLPEGDLALVNAVTTIENVLRLPVADFRRLMDVRAKVALPNPLVADAEWADVFRILTRVRRMALPAADRWEVVEANNQVTYWRAFKARLPKWRASRQARRDWQAALTRNSGDPIVDPDVIDEATDFTSPLAQNGAYPIYRARKAIVDQEVADLENTRAAAGPAGGLGWFEARLADRIGISLADLTALDGQRRAGADIAGRVAQLGLTRAAFAWLVRTGALLAAGQALLASEWSAANSIFVQVLKGRRFAAWREEERLAGMTLGPDFFQAAQPAPLQFPLPAPRTLPAWRATARQRSTWTRTVKSRVEQEQAVVDAFHAIVDEVEEETLPSLRDALIDASDAAGADTPARAKWLSDRLLIDLQVDGCHRTTRISQAIETLQQLLWSLRTGFLGEIDRYQNLRILPDHFDEDWRWIGSYSTWRAAVFVFLYPENLLHPALRELHFKSAGFQDLVGEIRRGVGLRPADAANLARAYQDYYRDVTHLEVEASCHVGTETYWYARAAAEPTATGRCYWSVYREGLDPERAQSTWLPIGALNDRGGTLAILGAVPVGGTDERPASIRIFAKRRQPEQFVLATLLHDYRAGHRGLQSEADVLDLPFNGGDFAAVVNQIRTVDQPPRLILVDRATGQVYDNWLTEAGNKWDQTWRMRHLFDGGEVTFGTRFGPNVVRTLIWEPKAMIQWFGAYFVLLYEGVLTEDGRTTRWLGLGYPDAVYDENDVLVGQPVWHVLEDPNNPQTFVDGRWIGGFLRPRSDVIYAIGRTAGDRPFLYEINSTNIWPMVFWPMPPAPTALAPDSGLPASRDRLIVAERHSRVLEVVEYVAGAASAASFWSARMLAYHSGTLDSVGPWSSYDQRPWMITPSASEPLPLVPAEMSESLLERRDHNWAVYWGHEHNPSVRAPRSTIAYLDEYYYFVPVLIALELQRRGYYVEALDWLRTVYDYVAPANRKVWDWLIREEAPDATTFRRAANWLQDPLNPHAIASIRPNAYTRYTLQVVIRCLLEAGDAEFTADTSESNKRATNLYEQALRLLTLDILPQPVEDCETLMAQLEIEVGGPTSAVVGTAEWIDIRRLVATIEDVRVLAAAVEGLTKAWQNRDPARPPEALAADMRAVVRTAKERERFRNPGSTVGDLIAANEKMRRLGSNLLLANEEMFAAIEAVGRTAGEQYVESAAVEEAVGPQPRYARAAGRGGAVGAERPAEGTVLITQHYPAPALAFCIPPNPIFRSLRLHADLNLYKLRHCRNIAGLERALEPYATTISATSGLPVLGGNGQLVLPGAVTLRPSQYRFPVLIGRAKQLLQAAAQMEATMLSAIERKENEELNLLRARHEARLARAQLRLQDLMVREAEDSVELATLQRARSDVEWRHFDALMTEGYLDQETASLILMAAAAGYYAQAANAASQELKFTEATAYTASELQTLASLSAQWASYERQLQQWAFQRDLAAADLDIGDQQIKLAEDKVRIAGQQRFIAELQSDQDQAVIDFLTTKFATVDLYAWISDILEGIYRFFLQQATAMAKLAANQLAFERQQTPSTIIQDDYWDPPAQYESEEGTPPDRRGLTGSARLLEDIARLEQEAFETDRRPLQLTRSISLARLDPYAFARFRQTGTLSFRTTLELFDRDFPGHYLRQIKRVRVSVVALVPPVTGIRASLASTGLSRMVVAEGGVFQTILIRRAPESIVLTSPRDATGLFELEQQSDKLLPFENLGVDTTWEFQMPRASNPFDFRTVADVVVTIDYSALDSDDYRQRVIREMDGGVHGDQPFSFRHHFADAWYDLHHPEQYERRDGRPSRAPMTVEFTTRREDFPANVDDLAIAHVGVYVIRTPGRELDERGAAPVEIALTFRPRDGATFVGGSAASTSGVYGTRHGNADSWFAIANQPPLGVWTLSFPDTPDIRQLIRQEVDDILFLVTYAGSLPQWPR
jgi:receptor-binding and translocation channel-forming TcA subunit of Tc toxin/ABC toxin-like protein